MYSQPDSHPAWDYLQAIERINRIETEETSSNLNPLCTTRLLGHGHKTARAIVFLHGFTNCPQQFSMMGKAFFDQGYNVYLPRIPHHGLADRLTDALALLSAEEMAAFASSAVDIAAGLGEDVIAGGISGGGNMALWLYQNRPEVALAVAIAPFLGVGFIPAKLNRLIAYLLWRLPNRFRWWDPRAGASNPLTVPYQYPRYPSRALGEVLRLGRAVTTAAHNHPPEGRRLLLVTNANDRSVNNQLADELITLWRRRGVQNIVSYGFERALGLPHDLIGPDRPDQKINIVYPKLIAAIHQAMGSD